MNLEQRYGIDPARRIDLPADPEDAEGMKAVYAKLGMPEKPDGYGFKLDDKATDADKGLVGAFGETAHKLGLSVKQAQGLMEFMGTQVAADQEAATAALAERATAGKAALEKEFGQAFEPRLREIRGLVEKYGDPELAEAVKGDNIHGYPNLAKLLGKLVERMAEPGAAGGQSGDADTGARAMTPAQARAAVQSLNADPVKGKALTDKDHPQHAAVVAERSRLLAMADGRAPA
ncbi:hypothetical protein [Phenylobacterium sp.]|uniref:hypothetical protein n=1 Tax=Phenylobacterium sp. TaxID=1871053 RepID=UPI002DE2C089|nr:hypothetical protein [Phenylobacterium sp.]